MGKVPTSTSLNEEQICLRAKLYTRDVDLHMLPFALGHENDCFSDTLQKIPSNERIRIIPLVMWYNTV